MSGAVRRPAGARGGIVTLAEALDLFPGARIEVIGAGAEEARIAGTRASASSVASAERGAGSHARAAYLVLPALAYQSVPRPLIEAFANAIPVIASRIGLLAEIVEPGRNGLLFEPGRRAISRGASPGLKRFRKMRQMGEREGGLSRAVSSQTGAIKDFTASARSARWARFNNHDATGDPLRRLGHAPLAAVARASSQAAARRERQRTLLQETALRLRAASRS